MTLALLSSLSLRGVVWLASLAGCVAAWRGVLGLVL